MTVALARFEMSVELDLPKWDGFDVLKSVVVKNITWYLVRDTAEGDETPKVTCRPGKSNLRTENPSLPRSHATHTSLIPLDLLN